MNYLNLTNEGGVLAFQELLAFMQDSYSDAIANICQVVGDNVIIEGCEVSGATISNGTVIINGEVLPFEGGRPRIMWQWCKPPTPLRTKTGRISPFM